MIPRQGVETTSKNSLFVISNSAQVIPRQGVETDVELARLATSASAQVIPRQGVETIPMSTLVTLLTLSTGDSPTGGRNVDHAHILTSFPQHR